MKRTLVVLALLLSSPLYIHAQENALRYLDSIEKKYSGLKDYTTEVTVHFDIETFKAPDMHAKLYYKTPDKMKVESKRVFLFPREGGYFNPSQFKKDGYNIRFLERLIHDGRRSVKIRLTPKKAMRNIQDLIMIIDSDRNVIRESDMTRVDGRKIRAVIEYGSFGGFDLPTYVQLTLDIPSVESDGARELDQFVNKEKRVVGKIEITYSNYTVNSGLSDELFREQEPFTTK